MYVEHTINDLIEMGWVILDERTNEAAVWKWKTQTLDCLTFLLGPNHIYVIHLKDFFRKAGRDGLLAGTGILTAAREVLGDKPNPVRFCEDNMPDTNRRAL